MEEIEPKVAEKPATHKRNAQRVAMGAFVALILILIFVVIKRINGGSQVKVEQSRPAAATEQLTPDQQLVIFQDRLNSAENDLAREKRNKQQLGADADAEYLSEYDRTIARLKKELADEKATKNMQSQERYVYERGAQNTQPAQKTWQEMERDRVRNARYAGSSLNLGFRDVSAQANPRTEQPAQRTVMTRSRVAEEAEQRLARYESVANQNREVVNGFGSIPSPNTDNGSPIIGRAASEQTLGPKVGQYLLPTGAVIKAALDQRAISDYTGSYRCRITHDVYDVTKRFILIPKGASCTGSTLRVTNVNEPIQARMALNINWVVLPDGRRISFKSQQMLDHEGINAVKGEVDRHLLAQFLGVAAYALVAKDTTYNTQDSVDFEGNVSEGVRGKGSDIAEKYLNLVPTIELDYGDPLLIFIEEQMYIYPWRRVGEQFING